MQLRVARLCLDCEEVHDTAQCPLCASETFTYLVRWIPSDERRRRPRTDAVQPTSQTAGEVDTYRRIAAGDAAPPRGRHLLQKGVVGLAALGLVGWLWGRKDDEPGGRPPKGRS